MWLIEGKKAKFKKMCGLCKGYFIVFVSGAANQCYCDNCRNRIHNHNV